MINPSLWACLRHPAKQLVAFETLDPRVTELPVACWTTLVAIAILGSCFYGATLGLVVPGWNSSQGALLITLSAGLAWCVLGPVLLLVTRLRAFAGAHACLVTMAYGELVLAAGALLNILSSGTRFQLLDPAVFNIGWVALSNVVMAAALSIQLHAVKVPVWKTLLLWVIALNGSGLLFFIVLKHIFEH